MPHVSVAESISDLSIAAQSIRHRFSDDFGFTAEEFIKSKVFHRLDLLIGLCLGYELVAVLEAHLNYRMVWMIGYSHARHSSTSLTQS